MVDLHEALQRRPDEPSAAHTALLAYAGLGPARSLEGLAEQWRSDGVLPPTPTRRLRTLAAWSSRWDWQARVAEYDEDRAAAELAAAETRWAERREAAREESWHLAQQLRERALTLLSWPIEEQVIEQRREESPDGRTVVVHTTVVKPARWSARDITTFAEVYVRLARLAAGMDTEQRRVIVEGLEPDDLESLTDEELDRLYAKAAKRRRAA